MRTTDEAHEKRKSEYGIDPHILYRWSPRALSPEELPEGDLMALFEAARWAPSSFNNQPWKFIYAKRGTKEWDVFFSLLGEFNRSWAKNAGVLVVVISKKTFDYNGKPSRTHMFDAGAAWENLAIEASRRGLVAHGMEGFDYGKAREKLEIPDGYDIACMVAIGKKGRKEDLPKELREREEPSQRKPLGEIMMEGKFKK